MMIYRPVAIGWVGRPGLRMAFDSCEQSGGLLGMDAADTQPSPVIYCELNNHYAS